MSRRVDDADTLPISSLLAKERAVSLPSHPNLRSDGSEELQRKPTRGFKLKLPKMLSRHIEKAQERSTPNSPSTTKIPWTPRRMLPGVSSFFERLSTSVEYSLHGLSSTPTESARSPHEDELAGEPLDPSCDGCMKHRVSGCPHCEEVMQPIATHKEAMLVLRKRFLARAIRPESPVQYSARFHSPALPIAGYRQAEVTRLEGARSRVSSRESLLTRTLSRESQQGMRSPTHDSSIMSNSWRPRPPQRGAGNMGHAYFGGESL